MQQLEKQGAARQSYYIKKIVTALGLRINSVSCLFGISSCLVLCLQPYTTTVL